MTHLQRVRKLQENIQAQGWAGVILFYSRDLFYYTGMALPAFLVVGPDDFSLFVKSHLELARGQSDLPPETIVQGRRLGDICAAMFPGPGWGETVGTELDLLAMDQSGRWREALGARQLVNCSPLVLEQRMVKDAGEMAMVEAAAAAAHAGHLAALATIAPGRSELEVAAAVENAQRLAGSDGVFFFRQPDVLMSRGPVASGPEIPQVTGTIFTITGQGLGPAMPAGPSRRVLAQDDLVLVDIPPCVGGYHADQTRMYCAGQPSDRARDLMARLRAVADTLIADLRPGMSAGDAQVMAEQRAADLGVGDSFLAFPGHAKAHFVGHGVGLEINEPPLLAAGSDLPLKDGMVLALEMHLMEPDGLTVKLEDTVHLTESGCRLLTTSHRDIGAAAA